MEFKTNLSAQEFDVIELTIDEYDNLNKCYKAAIEHKNPHLYQSGLLGNITHMILTDGMIRAPVTIKILEDGIVGKEINNNYDIAAGKKEITNNDGTNTTF